MTDPMTPEDERDMLVGFAGADEAYDAAGPTTDGPAASPDGLFEWGINPKTGRPYTMSPERRAETGRRLAAARAAAVDGSRRRGRRHSAPPRTRAGRAKAAAAEVPQYAQAAAGVLQLPAFVLGMLGRTQPVFALDAAAISMHTPGIAKAVQEVAMQEPRVAAVLDRVLKVGPFGALLAAVVPLVMQLAANHKIVQPIPELGILDEQGLVDYLERANASHGDDLPR